MIKKAWTAYAALLTAAVVIGEATNLAQGGTIDARTFANWVVTGVLLVATWGYALHKPLGEHNTDGLLVFTSSLAESEIARLSTVVASKCANEVAGAGSVKSSAGT